MRITTAALAHACVCMGSVSLFLWGSVSPVAAIATIVLSHIVAKRFASKEISHG